MLNTDGATSDTVSQRQESTSSGSGNSHGSEDRFLEASSSRPMPWVDETSAYHGTLEHGREENGRMHSAERSGIGLLSHAITSPEPETTVLDSTTSHSDEMQGGRDSSNDKALPAHVAPQGGPGRPHAVSSETDS
ncbi:hypothetical protein EIP86_005874 [Pleurotus ostreatoroseus]|nr:hypothetical protein EIP86_005874 [Pleurotus ostreatoroseus]